MVMKSTLPERSPVFLIVVNIQNSGILFVVDFIFSKITQGFMMMIVSLLALLNEIFTNPQIL